MMTRVPEDCAIAEVMRLSHPMSGKNRLDSERGWIPAPLVSVIVSPSKEEAGGAGVPITSACTKAV